MKPTVFIGQPVPERVIEFLQKETEVTVYPHLNRQITGDELAANAMRHDWIMLASDNIVPASLIESCPTLKGIATVSRLGLHIDLAAATRRKLPVISADPAFNLAPDAGPGVRGGVSLATADLTVGMLVALAYRLVEADRYTRSGHFKQEQTMALMGVGCAGKTAGLVGLGKVAEYMVPRLRAFDMDIIYTKRSRLRAEREEELGIAWVDGGLDEVLKRSDFVCIECAYTPETHALIGARELGLMKSSAYLVNTARGRIVDQAALIEALENRTIAGAALDVFWDEPPHTYDPFVPDALRQLDNVVLAPHNGGATWDARGPRMLSIAQGIFDLMKGKRPAGLLNPQIYD